uniref:MADS-box domain-containing protein n=1 Tax=Kalanchoe fedtschenkoi TaxID=63787 RepID=A0A7N0TU77_KALFE
METGGGSRQQEAGKKKTKGRQKTQMRLVQREEDRLITFSKRKAGINKKATELCVMCDAEVAFILFSPKGNAFAYGHPDVRSVMNKFLGREEQYPVSGDPRVIQIMDEHRRGKHDELVDIHNMLQSQVNQLAQLKEAVKQMSESRGDQKGWWDAKVADMKTPEEVKEMHNNIVGFQEALCRHMEMLQFIHQAAAAPPPPPPNPIFVPAFIQETPQFLTPPPMAFVNPAGAPVIGLGGDPGGEPASGVGDGGPGAFVGL